FTGMRPGEKLFEELRTDVEGVRATEHPQIFAVHSDNPYSGEEWEDCLVRVREAVHSQEEALVQDLLAEIVARG
ncbi:MAG TPA: polysaccharide biosynthesis protein, partial [Chroococcales cyanobacterium]